MNVALPEVDGRILARAISFKAPADYDPLTQSWRVVHRPVPDRVAFTARLAAAWARLRRTPAAERRVAVLLANYPTRDGRIGNGVGLDTPASAVEVLRALGDAGYRVEQPFADGDELIRALAEGPTNSCVGWPRGARALAAGAVRGVVRDAAPGGAGKGDRSLGRTVGRPSARGRTGSLWHSWSWGRWCSASSRRAATRSTRPRPTTAPTSSRRTATSPSTSISARCWACMPWCISASTATSNGCRVRRWRSREACLPEVALGPLPHLYPFIVNDPGEGTQAKRRAAGVIIDHLTPPLTRAEGHGELREIEGLLDEYHLAADLDPRRAEYLEREIVAASARLGLLADLDLLEADRSERLRRLDGHLCELKELQIRDGLHVLGRSPEGGQQVDLLVALARAPRGRGDGGSASLLRALASDLGLGDWDPLGPDLAQPWTGPRPLRLERMGLELWRTAGDTVERLEQLARASGRRQRGTVTRAGRRRRRS